MRVSRIFIAAITIATLGAWFLLGEEPHLPVFRLDVDMVTVSFTVTDSEEHFIKGLKPDDIRVLEDGIPQKIVKFSEFSHPTERPLPDTLPAESNIFILFDTSNCMYSHFAYAEDAIADFIRRMKASDSAAVYTFSGNLIRLAGLTQNRDQAIAQMRRAVAGDNTALYNCLLLTLRDAAKVAGRKVIIVFSNGPDNASVLSPDDVRRVAEDEGISIYVISTNESDPISNAVFHRITKGTGGKTYFAKTWQRQSAAFRSIGDDLANSYLFAYYPQQNPNRGFRKITVDVVSDAGKQLQVRARSGYHARNGHER
ncbi:MAG: von Willebrand factor, type [Bryobacterales bacterium]|nr:von Willebrand factor, type [Bryobacterales bacterium]